MCHPFLKFYLLEIGRGGVAPCISYPIFFTHLLLTLHCTWYSIVKQRVTVFARLGSTAAINKGISRGDSLNIFSASLNCFLISLLTVASSSSDVSVILDGWGLSWGGRI